MNQERSDDRADIGPAVNRRGFLGAAAAIPLVAAAAPTASAAARRRPEADLDLSDLAAPGQLWDWEQTMVGFGQRIGGTASHRRWLDFLEDQFQRSGLVTFRDSQKLTADTPGWEATKWDLSIGSRGLEKPVPVASYYPYSGETPAAGVRAELVDVGAGTQAEFAARDLRGKIGYITATFPSQFDTYGVWTPSIDYLYDPDRTLTPTTPFRKACFNVFSPTLSAVPALAKQAGCAALVIALDATAANAAGQYLPFAKPHAGIPILYVSRETGRQVKTQLASGNRTARLRLRAALAPASVDNLTAVLPGTNKDEYLWLLSHSDGVNACEENGGIGFLSLARHFASRPRSRRNRSLAFHLTLHMTPYVATNGAFFEQARPDIFSKVVGLMHVEHLGQRDWIEDPDAGTFQPTGQPEPAFMDVSRNPHLIDTVTKAIRAEDLRRTAVTSTTYSVGSQYDGRLPTVGFMTYPNQMLSWGVPRGRRFSQSIEKVDPQRMAAEIRTLARVAEAMDAMPTATLAIGTEKEGAR
ncbi:hypothetical protein [Actinomadura nitritigenes]|uniref:hypothetical protein n=1 Tax=Actinomadura nitritigenes TaxID=134602 RepID=UPI003D8B4076